MTSLTDIIYSILQSWPNRIVVSLLLFSCVAFVVWFFVPALRTMRRLNSVIDELKKIQSAAGNGNIVDLDSIETEAMSTGNLQHLWKEYAETLHSQKRIDAMGHEQIDCWRATVMAETFFTERVLIDTPLKTEFFRHLPGILTGIGIIGTFIGLIQGLLHFEVSNDPDAVRASLSQLLHAVGHAFFISASAIGIAMLFTAIEKSLVTGRYRQVEILNQLIDGFFNAGAGEEYLARLVKASETSATQAMQLKDALVTDLREILVEMTTRQVEASVKSNQQMSQELAKAFADSIRDPMDRITATTDKLGSSQGDAVNKMLTDVLADFSAKMQDMFGGQLQGMADLLSQTNNAMLGTVTKFDQLAANLQDAGKGAADAMADRLQQAIASMEVRQADMSHQMSQFVEQMRTISKTSQTEANQQLQVIMTEVGGIMTVIKQTVEEMHQQSNQANRDALALMGQEVQAAVANLKEQTQQAEEKSSERQERVAAQSEQLISELVAQVRSLGQRVTEAAEAMNNSTTMVTSATKSAIERMNTGADSLLAATGELSAAEKRVAGTLGSMQQVSQGLQSSATSLSLASSGVQGAFNSYKSTSEFFSHLVNDLKSIIETAKADASLSAELVGTLRNAAEKLSEASGEADRYLEGVSEVLAEAHQSFAENIEKTLRTGNATFHEELSNATQLLKGAVQELGDTLDLLATRK